ncbi:MAG TPA: hypothetical protein VMN03_05130 [Burkholderiales bacterium]|nr:hypothetical protein [Burkholderiales bacterium]
MLHEFLSSNREELISRCRAKVRLRFSRRVPFFELKHGVPVFLGQLVEALRHEQTSPAPQHAEIPAAPAQAPRPGKSRAALHGKEMLQEGYTVDQVVHDYGDICQAVTELAHEMNAPVTVEEFNIFNRLLDNAIADAVVSFGHHRDQSRGASGAHDPPERLDDIRAQEQRELLDTALHALNALRAGHIGMMGATGALLADTLKKLRDHITPSAAAPVIGNSGLTHP